MQKILLKTEFRRAPLQFITGWHLVLARCRFLLRGLMYAVQRRRYPLFRFSAKQGGLLYTIGIVRGLKWKKQVRFNGVFFSSLILPHFPSPVYDRMVANGGLNVGAAGTTLRRHIDTVILAITRRCPLRCSHCYEQHNLSSTESVSINRWKEAIVQIQQFGAGIIVLSGGEPLSRYQEILKLLATGDKGKSDFHLHTSGQGVTHAKACALRDAGLIAAAVGLDDVDEERHDTLRRCAGAQREAISALRVFHNAGVLTYVNLCLSRNIIRTGDLWRYFELVKDLNVAFIQMLEPRPCGGYLNADDNVSLTEEDRNIATEFFLIANTSKQYRNYPVVHYVAYAESPRQLGCRMAGLSHLYVDSMGNVNPCVFLPVSFGNIFEENFSAIYGRMRQIISRPIRSDCPSLLLADNLRNHVRSGNRLPVPINLIKEEWNIKLGKDQLKHVYSDQVLRSYNKPI